VTFEEAKDLLLDMRAAKRRANAIKKRIADLETDRDSIQSALTGGMPHGNEFYSRVESLAIRIETEREKHIQALEAYFALEDKLAEAVQMLDPIEQDVIIGCYMDGKCNWQVAQELYLGLRTVERKKVLAVKKISQILDL